jgi:hypothetical protein
VWTYQAPPHDFSHKRDRSPSSAGPAVDGGEDVEDVDAAVAVRVGRALPGRIGAGAASVENPEEIREVDQAVVVDPCIELLFSIFPTISGRAGEDVARAESATAYQRLPVCFPSTCDN